MKSVVILCGPEYPDEAAGMLGRALDQIALPPDIEVFKEVGRGVTRERLAQILQQTQGSNQIKIFVGHGTDDALLGPNYAGCVGEFIESKEYSKLYDRDLVNSENACLFAFCCNSASALGEHFSSAPGRTFLGFDNLIGYELANDECVTVWTKIIQLISEEIVRDGRVSAAHEESLKQLYTDAIDYFRNGDGRRNESKVEMMLCLINHRRYLKRFGGDA
ncbi:MAG: hypothetical protein ABL984_03200 [Pyrinomonadaceae bacterium]